MVSDWQFYSMFSKYSMEVETPNSLQGKEDRPSPAGRLFWELLASPGRESAPRSREGLGAGPGAGFSLLNLEFPYTGENQTVYLLATPAPSPALSAQTGPPLVTYVLPPPGGEGHVLSWGREPILPGGPPAGRGGRLTGMGGWLP